MISAIYWLVREAVTSGVVRTCVAKSPRSRSVRPSNRSSLDLGRLQGLAKTAEESFVAFLIASAQREAGSRANRLMAVREPEAT